MSLCYIFFFILEKGRILSKILEILNLRLIQFQLKAVVVDDNLAVLHETSVQFDNDLPEFRYV